MKKNMFVQAIEKWFVLSGFVFSIFQGSIAQTYCTSQSGTQDGYYWELWNQDNQGTSCMTLGSGCLFSCTWNGIQNSLARRGLKYDETREHQEIGTFTASYNCNYNPSSASGNSYLSVYGWTTDPLIEYYIVEDWRNWIPSMAGGAVSMGTISVNEGTYEIIRVMRYNAPNITGNDTDFPQYFSIRQSTRDSGTINISEHFNKWESLGMNLGNLYEVSFVVEGYQNSGNAEFTSLDVSVSSIDPTSVANNELSSVKIYPNPGTGIVSIDLGSSESNAQITICDLSGKVFYSASDIVTKMVEVTGLKTGLYIVNISSSRGNYIEKLNIQ
jgi:endo-1,4-beta-xylanase